ncbi:MAG: CTP synthetase [Planctomycetaceae bacterium]|nr:CTP synthetase [Planctomycetaceae bacterium]
MTKHIFVTGGVVSSLGKGLTSASIGMLLERRGLSVRMQKLDPYINVDPGTMSPYQHGEVYVLDDGSETDLDLGHYERFTNSPLTRDANYTTGQIYLSVIEKERRGEFLGKTVQVIPHITNEIKSVIHKLAADDVDVVITEIGGTVGDIESQPFLEAIRQFSLDVGKENCLYIHLTLVPYLKAAAELKTKPTQHSVGQLREIGIQPDVLICRCERSISREDREKIGLFCNVPLEAVIEEKDKDFSIYEVPLSLVDHGLDELIVKKLQLPTETLDLDIWRDILHRLRNPEHEISIAVVGKYAEHVDAYKSIYEAVDHAGMHHHAQIRIGRIHSEEIEREGPERILSGYDGILIPGGFGERGIEGKVEAIRFAREREIPFFGICLGMQCAVIEYGRSVVKLEDAHSTEFDKDTPHPVICLLDEQKKITHKGGTMRLGTQPCTLDETSRSAICYGREDISERHRHRYEFNNVYRQQFTAHGMLFAGLSPDEGLVEIVELPEHPWFVAVQFHPEFKSKPTAAQPLFAGFVGAAIERRSKKTGAAQEVEAT